jgi:repressor LexA
MSDFGEVLRSLRKSRGLTQEQLGERFNITKTGVSYWESGKATPSLEMMEKLADFFDVDLNTLIKGNGSAKPSALSTLAKRFPVYDLLSCGTGGFVDDQIIDYVVLPAEMFSPSKEYFAQYAKGDSMINAGIKDGSLLIFEKTSDPQNGMIGCFCIDENIATCKRLSINGSQIILIPENPAYSPIIVPPENFRCLGKLAYVVDDRRNG